MFYDPDDLMTEFMDKAINEVYQKLSIMQPEEFRKKLEQHKNGDIAKIILYSGALRR